MTNREALLARFFAAVELNCLTDGKKTYLQGYLAGVVDKLMEEFPPLDEVKMELIRDKIAEMVDSLATFTTGEERAEAVNDILGVIRTRGWLRG
jgi:hypothetical protein